MIDNNTVQSDMATFSQMTFSVPNIAITNNDLGKYDGNEQTSMTTDNIFHVNSSIIGRYMISARQAV